MKEHKGNERSSLGLERLVFFSDAVFAIAITLLVIDIRLPEDLRIAGTRELAEALWALLPRHVSYVISFVIIGSFWLKHHAMFEIIAAHDARLLVAIPLAWVHWLAPVVVWMAAPVLSMLVGRRPRGRRTDRGKSAQGPADGSRPRRRVMHSATARPEEPAQRSARSSS